MPLSRYMTLSKIFNFSNLQFYPLWKEVDKNYIESLWLPGERGFLKETDANVNSLLSDNPQMNAYIK